MLMKATAWGFLALLSLLLLFGGLIGFLFSASCYPRPADDIRGRAIVLSCLFDYVAGSWFFGIMFSVGIGLLVASGIRIGYQTKETRFGGSP